MSRATPAVATILGMVVLLAFVAFPLVGHPPVVRIAPILLFLRARHHPDQPTVALVRRRLGRGGQLDTVRRALFESPPSSWDSLSSGSCSPRFRSGAINAIDFTVYYDRPNFQTLLGHPLFVESGDDPIRAYRTYFAVHAHWIMLPVAGLYFLRATPLWLLGLSVVAVVAGAIYIFRIVQHTGGGGPLASASALAFVLNDNTARTLNYGFHTEVLYAWLVPWLIYAGLSRRWRQFAIAAVLCVSVKEDAFLVLLAVAVTLWLVGGRVFTRLERVVYLSAPVALALVNLAVYFGTIVPKLSATGAPFYANYWANYGPTTASAVAGMLRHPLKVALRGFLRRRFGRT
jgi:hypothetical protein